MSENPSLLVLKSKELWAAGQVLMKCESVGGGVILRMPF